MTPEVDSFVRFLVVCGTLLGSVLGSCKIIAAAKEKPADRAPSPPAPSHPDRHPEYLEKFKHGESRMDATDKRMDTQDERIAVMHREHVNLRIEFAELKPHFLVLKDSFVSLKGGMGSIEDTLEDILRRLPDK